MDNANAAAEPVTYPAFAAVALGITGSTVYQVIDEVGGMFEAAGAVFEGSPDAPGTLLALLPPSGDAALRAAKLGLEALAAAPTLRLGVDATEVHTKKEQDAKWQRVIDSAIHLQKAARSGEAIAGTELEQLTHGAIAASPLQVGETTYLLLTGVRDLAAVPAEPARPADEGPAAAVNSAVAPEVIAPATEPIATVDAPAAEPVAQPVAVVAPAPETPVAEAAAQPSPVPVPSPGPVDIPVTAPPPAVIEPAASVEPETAPAPVVEPVANTGSTMHTSVRWGGRFVGRDDQLAEVRSRFDRVVADRSPACLSITGEPGTGRSRVAEEFVRTCPEGTRVLRVACDFPDDGGARWPLATLIEAAVGIDPHASPDVATDRLRERIGAEPDADRLVPQASAMMALDGRIETDEVRWALRRTLEATSSDAPTVLLVDDADRTGAGFVRLLADVASASRGLPLFVLVTSRRETDGVPAIRLGPLAHEHAAALVTDLLGAVEPGIADTIARRALADPLLIEQTIATLAESGTLAPGQGRWMALADLGTVPLPDGPIGIIRRRLHALSPNALAVLGVAAVAGERVAPAPLADVLPAEAAAAMLAHLAELAARGFIEDEPDGTIRFRHSLIREATMGGAPDWARAAVHRRVASEIEGRAGERRQRFADTIGAHLAATREITPDGTEVERDEAIELLSWSADRAVELGDLDGAGRLERRVAGLLDHDAERRAELLYLAAEHGATAAPERPADREIAEAALAASVAGDDVDWRVRLLRARLRTTAGHEDALEGARSTADEAIEAFGEDDMRWAVSCAWALRGQVHAARAQNGLVADDLSRAADHAAAVGRQREETRALRGAAAALLDGPVGVEEAETRCRLYLERVRGPLAEHDLRSAIALLQARRSDFETARSEIAGSVAALDELGAAHDLAIVLHRAAQIDVLSGQPHAAEPQMQRALAAATNARDEGLRASLAGAFAHILVADEERLDEALALADLAEANAVDIAANVAWRMARARVLVRRSRGREAERLVREGVSLAEQTDSTDLRANTLVYAADVRRRAGRPAEAEPFERRALRLFERRGATAQAAAVAAILRPDPEADDAEPTTGLGDEQAAPNPTDEMTTPLGPDRAAVVEDPPDPSPGPAPPEETPAPAAEPRSTFISPPDDMATPEPSPLQSAAEESHRRWFGR